MPIGGYLPSEGSSRKRPGRELSWPWMVDPGPLEAEGARKCRLHGHFRTRCDAAPEMRLGGHQRRDLTAPTRRRPNTHRWAEKPVFGSFLGITRGIMPTSGYSRLLRRKRGPSPDFLQNGKGLLGSGNGPSRGTRRRNGLRAAIGSRGAMAHRGENGSSKCNGLSERNSLTGRRRCPRCVLWDGGLGRPP